MADQITPYVYAQEFAKKMNAAGNVCELVTIPDANHGCGWPVANFNFQPTITRFAEFLGSDIFIPSCICRSRGVYLAR